MNVLIIRSNPVNPDSRVEKEANTLLSAGHKVSILGWDREADYVLRKEKLMLANGTADIYRVGIQASFGGGMKKNLLPLLKFQAAIKRFIKEQVWIEAIHACDFDTAHAAYAAAKHRNIKFVYDIFDFYVDAFSVPGILKAMIRKMDFKIINHADAVIICSEKRKEQIEGSSPKKLVVIHNTPMRYTATENSLEHRESSRIKIAYVGILGNDRLIKEMAQYVVEHEELELHIGGFGLYEDYFTELSKANNRIIFYGKIPYNRTLELESQCDIITAIYKPTTPNHRFAAPNKFYEALMLGKEVIMIKNTGFDTVLSDNGVGAVMENYSAEEFGRAIDTIIAKRSRWETERTILQDLYSTTYSWEIMEQRLIALYHDLEKR